MFSIVQMLMLVVGSVCFGLIIMESIIVIMKVVCDDDGPPGGLHDTIPTITYSILLLLGIYYYLDLSPRFFLKWVLLIGIPVYGTYGVGIIETARGNNLQRLVGAVFTLISVIFIVLLLHYYHDSSPPTPTPDEVKVSPSQLTQATEEQKRVEATMQTTQNQINVLEKQLKSAYFATFKAKVEQERVIEVEGEAGCNQRTVQQCREAAEQEALNAASKQAAVNFLNAETLATLDPHGNMQLTKDEIRSQTRAVVMGHQIVECKFVTPAGSAYSCKIRATVKGLVPPELEQQLLK